MMATGNRGHRMVSASFDRELEDWEQELDRSDGKPLLAMIGGGIALILLCPALLAFLSFDLMRNALPALAVLLGLAAIVWVAAWFLAMRRAALAWKIGTGLAFGAIAILVIALGVGAAQLAVRRDAAMLRLIHINPAGRPELPPGTVPGPITRRGLVFFGKVMDERHNRDGLFIRLGMDRMASASALTAQPELLRDCDRFARAKPELDAADVRVKAISTQFRAELGDLIPNPAMRREMMVAYDKGAAAEVADTAQSGQLQRMQLDLAGDLCRLLAPRRWRARGTMFEFTSSSELQRYNELIQRWNAGVRGQQDLSLRFRSRLAASGFDPTGF